MLYWNRLSRTVGSVTNPAKFFYSIQYLGFLAGFGLTSTILLSLGGAIALYSERQASWQYAQEYLWDKLVQNNAAYPQENSEILNQIAQQSGLSEQAKITVCTLKHDCRSLRGYEPPISVASLMKVPIAEALLHKVNSQKINLNTPIYISEGNFTEDASDLAVEQNYTLGQLLSKTIVNSSNIAPNQLIDYLGRDYINQMLQNRGYRKTRVNAKFIGDISVPEDVGDELNHSTSNEITKMMVQIYNRQHPGDDLLIALLAEQHDQELGFAALEGSPAKWLGEKTGQNSWVLGTTLAMEIAGKKYIVTVIDDGLYSDMAIRDAIAKIAEYIAREGHL